MCVTLTACQHNPAADSTRDDITQHISIDTIQYSTYSTTYITVGTVRAESGKMAEVGLPMDGRIGSCFVQLGQQVHKGTPLFSVHSPEFADQCKAYFQAKSNYSLLEKAYAREQKLREGGIISEREMEEKMNELELAHRELIQWENTMKALGLDVESLEKSGEMNISAPISGEVVRMELTPGQYVRQDGPSLITLADLSHVWVSAQLKEYYLDRIHMNDSVEVHLNNSTHYHITGRIIYIGQLLSPETRSVEVLVACPNPHRELKPGMFAHVHFTAPDVEGIQIPSTAVLQDEESSFVYVRESDGEFMRRRVAIESGDSGMVRVLSGLDEGECFVSQGGIYIQ